MQYALVFSHFSVCIASSLRYYFLITQASNGLVKPGRELEHYPHHDSVPFMSHDKCSVINTEFVGKPCILKVCLYRLCISSNHMYSVYYKSHQPSNEPDSFIIRVFFGDFFKANVLEGKSVGSFRQFSQYHTMSRIWLNCDDIFFWREYVKGGDSISNFAKC